MKEYSKELLKVLDKKEIVSMTITKPQFKNSYTLISISIKD